MRRESGSTLYPPCLSVPLRNPLVLPEAQLVSGHRVEDVLGVRMLVVAQRRQTSVGFEAETVRQCGVPGIIEVAVVSPVEDPFAGGV